MHAAAVRPAGVYGVEPVKLERSIGYEAVRDVLKGKRVTPENHPGGGKFVHVEDVALAMLRAAERDEAAGRAFNLADCYAKRTRFAQHAAELVGADAPLVTPNEDPPAKNRFSKAGARDVLGVALDRGDEGLRAYVGELIEAIRKRES
jgi:nucleoside-diphosphate-sugar epimerase